MKAIDLLKKALADMGADGLCSKWCLGCSIENSPACGEFDGDYVVAKKGKDGLFYPMEKT
jgi:hypothetical protein